MNMCCVSIYYMIGCFSVTKSDCSMPVSSVLHYLPAAAAAAAKSLQLGPTLCDPKDCNLPGSSVHEIVQARILEGVAMLSRGSSGPRDQTLTSFISCIGRWDLYH